MNTVFNGELADDFLSKPLIPVIYCHGLCSNRTMHSGTAKDLASHGFIVFMLDHRDGTSSYVYNKDGSDPMFYDNSFLAYD